MSIAQHAAVPFPAACDVAARDAVTCDADAYRALMSAFPTGVSVVTTVGADGLPRGLTCSSLASVTLRPPTLLVCVHAGSSTLAALRTGGWFAVNLLHARARETAELFSAPVADRFSQVAWAPSRASGLPLLVQDAFAVAECRVTRALNVADHVVVLGEVASVDRTPDAPLLYGMRRFAAWQHHDGEADH